MFLQLTHSEADGGLRMEQLPPGDRSELIWKETLGFSQLPQVINPDAGFVLSANQTPFRVTHPSENPKQEDYSPVHGFS